MREQFFACLSWSIWISIDIILLSFSFLTRKSGFLKWILLFINLLTSQEDTLETQHWKWLFDYLDCYTEKFISWKPMVLDSKEETHTIISSNNKSTDGWILRTVNYWINPNPLSWLNKSKNIVRNKPTSKSCLKSWPLETSWHVYLLSPIF